MEPLEPCHDAGDGLKPYIQLRARISQAAINKYTIIALYALVRLIQFRANVRDMLVTAHTELQSECKQIDAVVQDLSDAQRIAARGMNTLISLAVTGAIDGLNSILVELITMVEEIILFLFNLFFGTYICLFELVVTGSVDAVIDASEAVVDAFNTTIVAVTSEIATGARKINAELSEIMSDVEKVSKYLGIDINMPNISFPELDSLKNVSIPTSVQAELQSINVSRTLDSIMTRIDQEARRPFNLLQNDVDKYFSNWTFDRSVLPIPGESNVPGSFCVSGTPSGSEGLVSAGMLIYKVMLALLVSFAVAMILEAVAMERWRWTCLQRNCKRFFSVIRKGKIYKDEMSILAVAQSPLAHILVLQMARCIKPKTHRPILFSWFVSYIFHPPALICLMVGVGGLTVCLIEYLVLLQFRAAVPSVSADVSAAANKTTYWLNQASYDWAHDVNNVTANTSARINNHVFGWVVNTTTELNTTLNTFTSDVDTAINTVFGDTVLADAIKGVLNCLVFRKIDKIEQGLTWLRDRAHVSFPKVPSYALASAVAGDENSNMTQVQVLQVEDKFKSAVSSGTTDVLFEVVGMFESSVREEALLCIAFVIAWLIVVVAGLVRVVIADQHAPPPSNQQSDRHSDWKTNSERMADSENGFYSIPYVATAACPDL